MKNRSTHPENKNIFCLWFLQLYFVLFPLLSFSQTDTTVQLAYDFNGHEIKENHDKVMPRAQSATLTFDRFGNAESALQLAGTTGSYFSLGVSPLLRSPNISLSLWAKINQRVRLGKGYEVIPILGTKNAPGFDYINALVIAYDFNSNRFSANSTKDSLTEVILIGKDSIVYNKWYHFVLICNNDFFAFYMDGHQVGKVTKTFETKYNVSDSLLIGHTGSSKNLRYMRGVVDDIRVFHKALSDKEVDDLYNASNPNENQKFLNLIYKLLLAIAGLIVLIVVIIIRNRRLGKKQREELELAKRISDLELKAVKAQMNPHFISNCLAAIQNMIVQNDNNKAGLYVSKFSFFLRQVLNFSDEDYISISEEIVMIRLFVELEQLRFKDSFMFELVVDEAFNHREFMIPSLVTQPFIENAIWHGLLPLKNKRTPQLTIRILLQNGFPVIEVEDNGIGRELHKKAGKKNKGMQLIIDKMDILNRQSKTTNNKIEILDLVDNTGNKLGTKVIIHLDAIKE